MVAYRLYFTDGDGHIVLGEWIEAATDGKAVELAEQRKYPYRIEIWRRKEFVAAVKPDPGPQLLSP